MTKYRVVVLPKKLSARVIAERRSFKRAVDLAEATRLVVQAKGHEVAIIPTQSGA